MNQSVQKQPARSKPTRTNDPARTTAEILAVATAEFAERGLAGARIDRIAELTRTSKRMIYYYFESKEGLYLAVLEEAYRRMRSIESGLHLADLPPEQALSALAGFTFDHHHSNQAFIRLVMNENMERAQYLAKSQQMQELNVSVLDVIDELYARGVAESVFRTGITALDIHAVISALTVFNVSNQYTFDFIFKRDGQAPAQLAARRQTVVDVVMRFVCLAR